MCDRINELREKANALVEQPGVYLMKDKMNEIIYVGKAKRLKHRVVSYFRQHKNQQEKVKKMVSQIQDFDYIICDSEFEALVLECSLIKEYRPKYNILLKDSKGYHYIKITHETYPRIQASKKKIDDHAIYLGPYVNSFSVKQLVDEVNKVFLLPTCHRKFPEEFKKVRPCLHFHIKNCDGLCKGDIDPSTYQDRIQQAIRYLKQGSVQSIKSLQKEMKQAAEQLEFEQAAKIRDKIQSIHRLIAKQKVMMQGKKPQDFIGLAYADHTSCVVVLKFRQGMLKDKDDYMFENLTTADHILPQFMTQYYLQGKDIPDIISIPELIFDRELYQDYLFKNAGHLVEITTPQRSEQYQLLQMAQTNALEQLSQRLGRKSKTVQALQQLTELLGLPEQPNYIESYDISNIGNDYMVGTMVVFKQGKPLKSAYRKFSIKNQLTQDDYACMVEIICRRFHRYKNSEPSDQGFGRMPDLILLDGGKGHVSVVTTALAQMDIETPIYGMVKDTKHKTRAIAKDGGEIQLSSHQAAFRLLTQIQEEVHRFTISFQRKKHHQKLFHIDLTTVPGIGKKRATTILRIFKTKNALESASVEQLKQAVKLSDKVAQLLYDHIHQQQELFKSSEPSERGV